MSGMGRDGSLRGWKGCEDGIGSAHSLGIEIQYVIRMA